MSIITKANNNLIIKADNSTRYATFANFIDILATWGVETEAGVDTEYVQLNFDNIRGYRFGNPYTNPEGPLTSVNGIDVSGFTALEIVTLINNSVLTSDAFSGTPVLIDDTTMVAGNFTAIMPLEDTVLDVAAGTNTVMVDGNGDPIDVSAYSGLTLPAWGVIYGHFTQVDLVSGSVIAYSNL